VEVQEASDSLQDAIGIEMDESLDILNGDDDNSLDLFEDRVQNFDRELDLNLG